MKSTVRQYFDKSRLLTVKNKIYAQTCEDLFDFQTKNDLVENDVTSKIIFGKYQKTKAFIIAKQVGIIAGIEEVGYLIEKKTDLKVKKFVNDGVTVKQDDLLIALIGNPLEILKFERTTLNILQRMSGIATLTNSLINKFNLKTPLAATRKTLWGLIDKKAVAVGGGLTHRLSLSDEILIKDNHVDLLAKKSGLSRLESLKRILSLIKESPTKRPFEIEVDSEEEAYFLNDFYQKTHLKAPLIMMLDNFLPDIAKKTIEVICKQKDQTNIAFELSGGINDNNIREYDQAGADVISLGFLTHSSKAMNISLNSI